MWLQIRQEDDEEEQAEGLREEEGASEEEDGPESDEEQPEEEVDRAAKPTHPAAAATAPPVARQTEAAVTTKKGWGPADTLVPPNKGRKSPPAVHPTALSKLKFIITGCLDSLEREEAEKLIEDCGGKVTKKVSRQTDYVVRGIDTDRRPIQGSKVKEAEALGKPLIDEDGLFALIRQQQPLQQAPAASRLAKRHAAGPPAGSTAKAAKLLLQDWARSMPRIVVDHRTWVV